MPVPNDWTLEGKVALMTVDTRGWAPVLASALAEAGADVEEEGGEKWEGVTRIDSKKRSCKFNRIF